MPRVLILDTFVLSSISRKMASSPVTLSEKACSWVSDCDIAGHKIIVPSICYYECIRELERRGALLQIKRLDAFCSVEPDRFISITDDHLRVASKMWASARNSGKAAASDDSLDCDMILAAQTLSLNLLSSDYVVATTNVKHLTPLVSAEEWSQIIVGS
jgi:predicted nucleic acid-binding protein